MEAIALQSIPGPLDSQLGRLLIALLIVVAVIAIGRLVLSIAWKLLWIAVGVVALLVILSLAGVV